MNIYIETNFVQELTFLQEEFQSCEKILELCEQKKVNLIVPGYCLVEPLEKLHRQKLKRESFQNDLNIEIKQLSCTANYTSQIQSIGKLNVLLSQSVEEENSRFEKYKGKILKICHILPIDDRILIEAGNHQSTYNLDFNDAIVFASVISHLKIASSVQSCFLNRNSKDFYTRQIRDELIRLNCKMIPSFEDGCNYILNSLKDTKEKV